MRHLAAWLLTVTALTLGMTAQTRAQASSLEAVQQQVGKTVFITDNTPVEKRGRLIEVNAASLTLLGDEGRRHVVAGDDVVRIDALTRPVARGLIIGAIVGAVMAMRVTAPGGSRGEALAGGTGLGALLGAGVSRLFPGRRTIYLRQP